MMKRNNKSVKLLYCYLTLAVFYTKYNDIGQFTRYIILFLDHYRQYPIYIYTHICRLSYSTDMPKIIENYINAIYFT